MEALLWLMLPLLVAGGSALLSFYIMQARLEVAISKERETLAEAKAIINAQKSTMEERIKATEEATRRATLDELMQDFRVEERSYVRENRQLARRSMVMQERVFFRNIPLSAWTEHELLIEDGTQSSMSEALPQPSFAGVAPLPGAVPMQTQEGRLALSKRMADAPDPRQQEQRPPEQKMLKTVAMPAPREVREPREQRALVPVAAFGAQ